MKNQLKIKDLQIEIPKRISVFEDKRTQAKTIALPFQFNDGSNGALMVCRMKKEAWTPIEHIKSITINFNEDNSIDR